MFEQTARAQARMLGHDAFKKGYSEESNPYEPGTELFAVWLAGWERADFEKFHADRVRAESNMRPHDLLVAETQNWVRQFA